MLRTASSLRNTENWFISNRTVHVGLWASVAVTFFGDDTTVKATSYKPSSRIVIYINLKTVEEKFALMLHVLRQTKTEQQGSDGLVWLTRTNPGPVQFVWGGAGHTLGLHVTVFVDSSQMQSWQLYSNLSLNWKITTQLWLNFLLQARVRVRILIKHSHLTRNALRINTSCWAKDTNEHS